MHRENGPDGLDGLPRQTASWPASGISVTGFSCRGKSCSSALYLPNFKRQGELLCLLAALLATAASYLQA